MASIVDIILRAKNQASKELNQVTNQLKGMDSAAKIALGGLSALAGGFALQQAGRFAIEMAQLNTQLERSAFAFDHFSGGADKAAANLRAVKRAAGGMVTDFEAQNIAVTALTQGLATNSQELENITRIARGIVSVSPIINDLESAFSQLGLTIANQSMMRLDQLGTSADEVKTKIAELKRANKDLTDEQAFSAALLEILGTKFDDLTDAAVNQASGLERLKVAWSEYRAEAAKSFGFIDAIAGNLADTMDTRQLGKIGADIATGAIRAATREQQQIADQINAIMNAPENVAAAVSGGFYPPEVENQIARLVKQFLDLSDAIATANDKMMAGAPDPYFVNNDALTKSYTKLEEDTAAVQDSIDKSIEALSFAAAASVYEITGNTDAAANAYDKMQQHLTSWAQAQQDAQRDTKLTAAIISEEAAAFSELDAAFYPAEDGANKVKDAVEKLGTAMSKLDIFVGGAAGSLLTFAKNAGVAQTASVNLIGAIAAAYGAMEKVNDGPVGLSSKQTDRIGNLLPSKELKQVNSELNAIVGGVGRANSAFDDLKSTISGIVSGAIGPVAGVDANDLLDKMGMRPDAINENARRLADIATKGFIGQDWMDEFAREVPDIYQALVNSGDPKMAAAQMLKDFQDGLLGGTGALIDKERAKELVRRALLGQSNTQSLIDEIAKELAAETGTAFSTVQAQAQQLLGGAGGMGGTSDTGAAFSRGMVDGVTNGSLGADLSGAVYGQVMASITLIEQTGTEAGNALVRSMSATFTNIPQNLIAALAGLVLPLVQAGITNQGTRTGAAGV